MHSRDLRETTDPFSNQPGAKIALSTDEIHLWLAYYDEINDPGLHIAYRSLLNNAEQEQELKFYFEKDRRRYLITRALVRTVLSRYVAVTPRDWLFSTNRYGRPEAMNPEAKEIQLCFNISHTHSLIVLGVSTCRALGVDVENIRAREAPIAIADQYFAPSEVAALAAMPHEMRQDRFFEYWTFKESYIKARGMGLSLPLDKFSFHYPDERSVNLTVEPELNDASERWQFWQFRPSSEYLVAVCAERLGRRTPRLSIRKTMPTIHEEFFAAQILRTLE